MKHKERRAERNLTEGPILKNLFRFALPMILGNLLQQIYNIVDTMIVGHYLGADALAAVGSSYSLMTFLTSIMIGLCMGCSASFSIAFGAGRIREMKEKIWTAFWMIGMITIVLMTLVLGFLRPILFLLQIPKEVYIFSHDYLQIIFCGLLFQFFYNYGAFFMRAVGNSSIPLYFLGISSLLNVFLDLLFVVGMHGGVRGAAIATIFSQGFSGIGILCYVLKKMRYLLPGTDERIFRISILKELSQYSIFTCLQQSVMNFGILMIQGLVNSFGTVVMASFAAAVKIDTIAYMPAQEFGNAYSLFVSQNYGAEKKERIRIGTRKAFLTSILFSCSISALIFLFAEPCMRIFIDKKETAIIAEGVRYLHIEGACYVGIGCLFLFYGLYRGIARPAFSLVLTIVSLGSRVLLAYMLAPHTALGVTAIWWAIPIGWLLADMTGFIYYRHIHKELYLYEVEKPDFQVHLKKQGIFRTLIEAIGTVYEEAERKGIQLKLESQHDQILLHDRYWTANALVYIIKNAIKYTEPGGEIVIDLKSETNRIGIEIRDTGCGIPIEDLQHILKKYYRGKNVRFIEGYGLGLYLAGKIIEKESGEIYCQSLEKHGTVMTVYLKKADDQ